MAGLDLDMPAALATAREMGASGWAAAELLLAMRMRVLSAQIVRQASAATLDAIRRGGSATSIVRG